MGLSSLNTRKNDDDDDDDDGDVGQLIIQLAN
jgi:hypothetical protein